MKYVPSDSFDRIWSTSGDKFYKIAKTAIFFTQACMLLVARATFVNGVSYNTVKGYV